MKLGACLHLDAGRVWFEVPVFSRSCCLSPAGIKPEEEENMFEKPEFGYGLFAVHMVWIHVLGTAANVWLKVFCEYYVVGER